MARWFFITLQKRVDKRDIRVTDSELIILLDKWKLQYPGLSSQNILKLWVTYANTNGIDELKFKLIDLQDVAKRLNLNAEYSRMVLIFSQIATFSPIMKSKDNCKFVADDLESLLVNYMKTFRGKEDL